MEASKETENCHCHVRERDEELMQVKCKRIEFRERETHTTFTDMCHFHTCKELGEDHCALKRYPCDCEACDRVIRLAWDSSETKEKQPRFQSVAGCKFASVLCTHFFHDGAATAIS